MVRVDKASSSGQPGDPWGRSRSSSRHGCRRIRPRCTALSAMNARLPQPERSRSARRRWPVRSMDASFQTPRVQTVVGFDDGQAGAATRIAGCHRRLLTTGSARWWRGQGWGWGGVLTPPGHGCRVEQLPGAETLGSSPHKDSFSSGDTRLFIRESKPGKFGGELLIESEPPERETRKRKPGKHRGSRTRKSLIESETQDSRTKARRKAREGEYKGRRAKNQRQKLIPRPLRWMRFL